MRAFFLAHQPLHQRMIKHIVTQVLRCGNIFISFGLYLFGKTMKCLGQSPQLPTDHKDDDRHQNDRDTRDEEKNIRMQYFLHERSIPQYREGCKKHLVWYTLPHGHHPYPDP